MQKNLTKDWLKGVNYAVFGLGDSSYQKYNVIVDFRIFDNFSRLATSIFFLIVSNYIFLIVSNQFILCDDPKWIMVIFFYPIDTNRLILMLYYQYHFFPLQPL